LDLGKSAREIGISLEEIGKALEDLCISFLDLCIFLREIYISLADLCISSRKTHGASAGRQTGATLHCGGAGVIIFYRFGLRSGRRKRASAALVSVGRASHS